MSKPTSLIRQTNLPLGTFESLAQLWDAMAQAIGESCFSISESALPAGFRLEVSYFKLIVFAGFNALLTGNWDVDADNSSEAQISPTADNVTSETLIRVGITFDPDAIATFIDKLIPVISLNAAFLETTKSRLQPNDPNLQSQFTVALVDAIAKRSESIADAADYPLACRPIEQALQQQKEQEDLINRVISQIRHSLELPTILETAVQQARQLLQADRLVIFQFYHPRNYLELSLQELTEERQIGSITYEAKASDNISSVLSFSEPDRCMVDSPHVLAKYYRGVTQVISNVEEVYAFAPCLLDLMRQLQVKAKLIAPIIVDNKLWGLSIAHQCDRPREWKQSESQFLLLIAEHLAVAIQQAQLYATVQQQAQTLEQKVTERTHELQEALKVAEAASRAKSQFLATMSHELKTPLTSIIGLSDTLLHWNNEEIKDKQQTYLKIIRDRGQHLQEIIDDILYLSELESKELVLNISEISLEKIARQTIQILAVNAVDNEIQLSLDMQLPDSAATFKADYRALSKILINLLSNGIKFTPRGGEVTLRIRLEAEGCTFEVEDTGIGIPESQQHLLFQKFQQLDSTYTRQYQGLGLGLALTKQLVELHQGDISLRSTVGVGSIFTVRLPILIDA